MELFREVGIQTVLCLALRSSLRNTMRCRLDLGGEPLCTRRLGGIPKEEREAASRSE